MYECPSCGAGLRFNLEKQLVECNYCGNEYNVEDIEKLLKETKGEKDRTEETYEAIVYRCEQCGAKLITTDNTIATFCSYCASTALLKKENSIEHKPKYVIPFKKTKEECIEAYKKKLRRAFFAPDNMAEEQQVEKIRGIYMPYWIYSFKKNGPYVSFGEKYKKRRGDYVYYDDYKISTIIDAKYSGLTHDATSNFSDSLSECIAPFSMKDKKDFSPAYLSGFYADSEDIDKDAYCEQSCKIANEQASKTLKKDPTYRKYNANTRVNMELESAELGLFPVYFLSTKNKTGDRISYAVINGQTGKVAADIPIDFKKYKILSIILAVIIFILLNKFFTVTPIKVLILSILFNVISWNIFSKQENKIYERENKIKKMKFFEKLKKGYKIIIGLIISIITLIMHPVYDLYYYSSALISIIMSIISFYEIIKELNILATRKLPQLEKRGGDENE